MRKGTARFFLGEAIQQPETLSLVATAAHRAFIGAPRCLCCLHGTVGDMGTASEDNAFAGQVSPLDHRRILHDEGGYGPTTLYSGLFCHLRYDGNCSLNQTSRGSFTDGNSFSGCSGGRRSESCSCNHCANCSHEASNVDQVLAQLCRNLAATKLPQRVALVQAELSCVPGALHLHEHLRRQHAGLPLRDGTHKVSSARLGALRRVG